MPGSVWMTNLAGLGEGVLEAARRIALTMRVFTLGVAFVECLHPEFYIGAGEFGCVALEREDMWNTAEHVD